ncbi:MAG: hypothetical protein NC217_08545 [Muribaculaceae bacterium]|nr:hypothetical protein [Muribaculaceae bacterium]
MSEHTNMSRAEREHLHEKENKERKIVNKIWLWLGVIVLVAILLYWLFAIGTFEGPNQ